MPGPRETQRQRHERMLRHERALWAGGTTHIAGVDEVGAGPWAGPVLAGCVVLDPAKLEPLVGVNDSKRLSPGKRAELAVQIRAHAIAWATAEASVEEIDRLNIRAATLLAMRRAVAAVRAQCPGLAMLLIDAHRLPDVDLPQQPIIRGDADSLSIAAASIVAKVTRDALLCDAAKRYPEFGFERHKGYGTAEHQAAIARCGLTPLHRRSFAPVRAALAEEAPRPRSR